MAAKRFEQMYQEEQRRADRQMLFAALRCRRGSLGRRRLPAALLWMLGLR